MQESLSIAMSSLRETLGDESGSVSVKRCDLLEAMTASRLNFDASLRKARLKVWSEGVQPDSLITTLSSCGVEMGGRESAKSLPRPCRSIVFQRDE